MKKYILSSSILIVLVCILHINAKAESSLDIEGGLVKSSYNDVRIPGNTGTKISLSEELDAENTEYFRIRYTIDIGERSSLSALYAPLEFESNGFVNRGVDFNGVTFAAGTDLKSTYRFDSYRLSYQYQILQKENLIGKIGFTGKIRDASIKLENDSEQSEKTNTGFVPLIYFSLDWKLSDKSGIFIEGDALAAPQGRAEDILVSLYSSVSDNLRLRVGYRVLEGGADNDEVYTFALVNYYSAGITVQF